MGYGVPAHLGLRPPCPARPIWLAPTRLHPAFPPVHHLPSAPADPPRAAHDMHLATHAATHRNARKLSSRAANERRHHHRSDTAEGSLAFSPESLRPTLPPSQRRARGRKTWGAHRPCRFEIPVDPDLPYSTHSRESRPATLARPTRQTSDHAPNGPPSIFLNLASFHRNARIGASVRRCVGASVRRGRRQQIPGGPLPILDSAARSGLPSAGAPPAGVPSFPELRPDTPAWNPPPEVGHPAETD